MKKFLALFFILASALEARADEVEFYSLEWAVDHASTIGIYKVVSPGKSDAPGAWQHGLQLELQQALKGDALPKTAQTDGKMPYSSTATYSKGQRKSGVEAGDLFLVICTPGQPVDFISLAPGNADSVVDADIEVLHDPAAVLRVVRDRIAHGPPAKTSGKITAHSPAIFNRNSLSVPFEIMPVMDAAAVRVPDDLMARAVTRCDLLQIVHGLQQYYRLKQVMPAGGNATIIAALIKEKSIPYFKPDLNAAGEFCDQWGTPYRIDASNPKFPWAYSCGPDKKDGGGAPGSDDVVSW